jgi:hypothetical protein
MPIDKSIIEGLKAEHGDVYLLEAKEESVVVTVPTRPQYRRFIEAAGKDNKRPHAMETLCRECVVYPNAETFDALLEKKPGLAATFSAKLLELAGVEDEAAAKKL